MCAVVALNDITQFFYLCSFYANLLSSTLSAMKLQVRYGIFPNVVPTLIEEVK